MSVKELVVGNLNAVFIGEKGKYDFLDFWDEISSLVFVDDVALGRGPRLIFKDIQIKKMGKDKDLVIIGRFVKSTVLYVKQRIENNELVPRDEKHASAPSAVFVYILKNHILLYWGEHPGYPSVKSFRTFISINLNKNRKKYIRLLQKGKTAEEKIEIVNKYPQAYVSYVPLPLAKSLESQFSDIIKISNLSVRQYYQNANINYKAVMGSNQSLMEAVKAQRMDYNLPGIEDIEGAKLLVSDIANAGESKFIVNGKTKEGKKQITNEGVQYSKYFNKIDENEDIVIAAKAIIKTYESDIEKGDIPVIPQKNSADKLAKVRTHG